MSVLEFYKVSDVKAAVDDYNAEHAVSFVSTKKEKTFGDTAEATIESKLQLLSEGKRRILWESGTVPLSGVPFVIMGRADYSCHQGKDRDRAKKRKLSTQKNESLARDHTQHLKRRSYLQVTKKVDCPSKITVQQVLAFPDFKIENDTIVNKLDARSELITAIQNHVCRCKVTYFVKFPPDNSHRGHVFGQGAVNERIDKRIIDKIYEYVRVGVLSSSEMKRHLDFFVQNELFRDQALPDKTRRRFYPSQRDITNHMYRAKVGSRDHERTGIQEHSDNSQATSTSRKELDEALDAITESAAECDIPECRKKQEHMKLAGDARAILKQLIAMTYVIKDSSVLLSLNENLKNTLSELNNAISHKDGRSLHSVPNCKVKRKQPGETISPKVQCSPAKRTGFQ